MESGNEQYILDPYQYLIPAQWTHKKSLPSPHTHMQKDRNAEETDSYSMTWINISSTHCYSLHVGFPSATHPQREQRISVATPSLAAIQYLQREREGRQESPWGHCPVRGQTNTDQVPQKLSAISTPNLRTEKQAPHTQRQNLKTQEQKEKRSKSNTAIIPLEQELMVCNCYKPCHFPTFRALSEELVICSLSSQFLPCDWAFQSQQVSSVWMEANDQHSKICTRCTN